MDIYLKSRVECIEIARQEHEKNNKEYVSENELIHYLPDYYFTTRRVYNVLWSDEFNCFVDMEHGYYIPNMFVSRVKV